MDHDANGKVAACIRQTGILRTLPFAFLQPPQALHAVEDLDKKTDGHLIRIEFKKGFKQT